MIHYWEKTLYVPPSGSKGLILGEIFGRNAGLTCTELLFVLFFPARPLVRGSPRLLDIAPFVEITVFGLGLGNAEPVAVTGALVGTIFGALRADMVGVGSSSFASPVLRGVKAGRFDDSFAGSGKAIASIVCSSSDSSSELCSFRADPAGLPAPLRILISEAGVAGLSSIAGMGADRDPGAI